MGMIARTTYTGIRCDKRGCGTELRDLGEVDDHRTYCRAAADAGWSLWASRSLRTYCPDHRPRGRHTMQEITNA